MGKKAEEVKREDLQVEDPPIGGDEISGAERIRIVAEMNDLKFCEREESPFLLQVANTQIIQELPANKLVFPFVRRVG